MHDSSELDDNINAYIQEWSNWVRERDHWITDVEVWDKHLRQLILLIHELDNSLPYERQQLSDHLDAINEHLATLELHGRLLNELKLRTKKGSGMTPDIKKDHRNARLEHDRVRDAHYELRNRHQKAMDHVDGLLGKFNEKLKH